jgi:LSD1 subclass zinc finger protein|tara:strand:+ start:1358 stop:1813 length:456 start_codon:yes stop_codon:yes gene_type:complete
MQGMTNAMRTKLEKQRKKTLPCSKCQTPMALHLAKNMSELKIKIIKCSWCSNPCKYQDGRTSIVCATCKKVVLIKQAEVKGKARESKKRFDPELLKEMRVLSREIRSNESKITNLKQQIRLWKMRLEKKPKVGNKRRGGQRARKAFKPQKM